MNICKLCGEQEATKKNTHYLTDAIIRTALNENGVNIREKGYYFNLSSDIPGIDFNFQRHTSTEKIESHLGRNVTDEEIQKAVSEIPFSVDFVFCPNCEKLFTEIENPFIDKVLPQLRSGNLVDLESIALLEVKTTRLFFLLQILRTSLSVPDFKISDQILHQLKHLILNHKEIDISEINIFPLAISYLLNAGDANEKTGNMVGYNTDVAPNIIYLNDFVIQFFESGMDVVSLKKPFIENHSAELKYVNYREIDQINMKIINDDERKIFALEINKPKMDAIIQEIRNNFTTYYFTFFQVRPDTHVIEGCVNFIINSELDEIEKYSVDAIKRKMAEYMFYTRPR